MKRLLLFPILLFVSLLDGQSAVAQDTNEPRLSLVIRGRTNIIKQGDEIPIEFVISNQGTQVFNYEVHLADQAGLTPGFKLLVKTTAGDELPDIRVADNLIRHARSRAVGFSGLHAGEAVTNIVTLNRRALVREPGHYEIVGSSRSDDNLGKIIGPLRSAPIVITVLPRTKEEMDAYIKDLTDQIEARFPIQRTAYGAPFDPVLEGLLVKLMFTCDAAIVPTMLRMIYDPGINGNPNQGIEALLYYVPHTEESKKAILQAAVKQGLSENMYDLLSHYEVNKEELKPIIERALAQDNLYECHFGATLAANPTNYDEAFTPRLIVLACGTTNDHWVRREAMRALACNRTDGGVKALKSMLNDADPDTGASLAAAICDGYSTKLDKRLHPEDFDANDVRPLTERLLKSGTNRFYGFSLAALFGDDTLTPTLVATATGGRHPDDLEAIYALAMNRTDEGVTTLKTLLNGKDELISKVTANAIDNGYKWRGAARGKPLRPDDFDAKFQHPETSPPK